MQTRVRLEEVQFCGSGGGSSEGEVLGAQGAPKKEGGRIGPPRGETRKLEAQKIPLSTPARQVREGLGQLEKLTELSRQLPRGEQWRN
jgi:hypothetical protein